MQTQSLGINATAQVPMRLPVPHAPAGFDLSLVGRDGPDRQELEAFVADAYLKAHGACLSHFLPQLLSIASYGAPLATVGIQPAANADLFLEVYVDSPIESEISRRCANPVSRHQIVEIGNLAATRSGASVALFTVLAALLNKAGFRWAVFTATKRVEGILNKMQFSPLAICAADPSRLREKSQDWGRYYADSPSVVVGDVRAAYLHSLHDPMLARHLDSFGQQIERLAQAIQEAQ